MGLTQRDGGVFVLKNDICGNRLQEIKERNRLNGFINENRRSGGIIWVGAARAFA